MTLANPDRINPPIEQATTETVTLNRPLVWIDETEFAQVLVDRRAMSIDAAQEHAMIKATNEKETGVMNASAITIDLEIHQRTKQGFALQLGHLLLNFLELQIPMVLGALVCYLLGLAIPASPSLAAVYHPGTYLFTIGDVFFLTVPVVVWMILRGHGWRYSLEMAAAMLVPVAAIVVLGQLTGTAYLLWLIVAMYPAMCLGMLVDMLYRRDHFTRRVRPN